VGLIEPQGGWRLVVARNLEQDDISNPEKQVSTAIIGEAIEGGEPVVTADASGSIAPTESMTALQLRSVACLPLLDDDAVVGFVYFDESTRRGLFDDAAIAALTAWLPLVGRSIVRATREDAEESSPLPGVITRSPAMQRELGELARIAGFDVSVLLTGETGTGKSLIAHQLHAASPRAAAPFVHVNCGALPEALIEAELFGAEAGAYTGAKQRRLGKFEAANGGTLFLDELDTMPLSCQTKLLVALQERKIQRLGANESISVDVRVIAAMSSDPFAMIDEGRLREDLYYRLAVFVAHLPPMRERPEDVPLLARHVLEKARRKYKLPPLRLSEAALDTLVSHAWPGNVRELENTLDRAALLARDGVISAIHFRTRKTGDSDVEDAPADLVGRLARAARHFVEEMERADSIRRPDAAEVFKSLVLLEAVRQRGSIEDAFVWLGESNAVKNRNHTRTVKREASRLRDFCLDTGARVPPELAGLA
jgi:transcriptional regulator with GAF, ATPase, and Fis domain